MPDASLRNVADLALTTCTRTVPSGVMVIDARGWILSFNAASQHLFGYSADEVIGRNVRVLIASDAHGRDIEFYLRTGFGNRRELIGRRKDGSAFPMDLSAGATREDDATNLVVIVDDLTECKHAEAQRERLVQQLIASNEELRDFARAASHDLQAPSRMVSAFCSLLSERHGDKLDAQGRRYLQLAMIASTRMHDLVDDLLDYARLEGAAERARWFECEECFTAAIANLRQPIREAGAVILVDAMPRLFANPIRFTRLAQNLLDNAIKYVAPGVVPSVRVSADSDEKYWRFSVVDNGIGIDPRNHERVFEPFQRLHSLADYQGTGLGLTICKKIADGFGGQVGVTSKVGEGSTFTFTIRRPFAELRHG